MAETQDDVFLLLLEAIGAWRRARSTEDKVQHRVTKPPLESLAWRGHQITHLVDALGIQVNHTGALLRNYFVRGAAIPADRGPVKMIFEIFLMARETARIIGIEQKVLEVDRKGLLFV